MTPAVLSSPLFIASLLVLMVLVGLQIFFDHRRITASNWLRSKNRTSSSRRKKHTFSIVIDLRRKATTILPLLDHLDQSGWNKLEVIVVIRQTAGPNAAREIASYRRQQTNLRIRIVKHRKGMDLAQVIRRYGSGELVLPLQASDRLSRDFFKLASTYFSDAQLDILKPKQQVELDHRLVSAFGATASVWYDVSHSSAYKGNRPRQYVRRRRVELSPEKPAYQVRYASNLSISYPLKGWRDFLRESFAKFASLGSYLRFTAVAIGVALLGGCLVLALSLSHSDASLLWTIIILGYGGLLANQLIGMRSYSLFGRLTLLLLSPFGLLLFTVLTAGYQARLIFADFRRLTHGFKLAR